MEAKLPQCASYGPSETTTLDHAYFLSHYSDLTSRPGGKSHTFSPSASHDRALAKGTRPVPAAKAH